MVEATGPVLPPSLALATSQPHAPPRRLRCRRRRAARGRKFSTAAAAAERASGRAVRGRGGGCSEGEAGA